MQITKVLDSAIKASRPSTLRFDNIRCRFFSRSRPNHEKLSIQDPPPPADPSRSVISHILGETIARSSSTLGRSPIRSASLSPALGAEERRPSPGSGPASTPSYPRRPELDQITPRVFRLHVHSTRHNTHISLTDDSGKPLISGSSGMLGFRNSRRGTYDAAYRLTALMLDRIHKGRFLGASLTATRSVEIVYRNYGKGRAAFNQALLGREGEYIRPAIVSVTDATRLKFGGTRSPKPRRLG